MGRCPFQGDVDSGSLTLQAAGMARTNANSTNETEELNTFALTVLDERAFIQFGNGLAKLLLGVHYDGAIPSYRLFDRLSGH
jgi:hypothetical protein